MTALIEALKRNPVESLDYAVWQSLQQVLDQALDKLSPKDKKQIVEKVVYQQVLLGLSKPNEITDQKKVKATFDEALNKLSPETKKEMVYKLLYKQAFLNLSEELVSEKNNLTSDRFRQGFEAILDAYVSLAKEGEEFEEITLSGEKTENADEIELIERLKKLDPDGLDAMLNADEQNKENPNPNNWICSPLLKKILLAPIQHIAMSSGTLEKALIKKCESLQKQNRTLAASFEKDSKGFESKNPTYYVIRLPAEKIGEQDSYYFIDKKNQSREKNNFDLALAAKEINPTTGKINSAPLDPITQMKVAIAQAVTREDLIKFSKELVHNRRKLSAEQFKAGFFVMLEKYEAVLSSLPIISSFDKDFINTLKALESESLDSQKLVKALSDIPEDSSDLRKLITAPIRHMATESSDFRTMAITLCSRLSETYSISDWKDDYIVIRVPKNKTRTKESYYIADIKTPLGGGGSGILLTAQKINPDTGVIVKNAPPLAVKWISEPKKEEVNEFDLQSHYFPSAKVEDIVRNQLFLFTEILREKNLRDFLETDEFKNLSVAQRLDLILQITFAINVISHETPSTKALVHRDIKPENIMVFLDEKGAIHAQVIDFGLSHLAPDTSQKAADPHEKKGGGTRGYIASEVLFKEAGLKSDTFSLAVVVAEILGVEDARVPRKLAWERRGPNRIANYNDIRLNLEKMWIVDGKKLGPPYLDGLENKIKNFVATRMDVVDYTARSYNDEVMRFFTEARKFAALAKEYMDLKQNLKSDPETLKALKICMQKMFIVQLGVVEFPFELFDKPIIEDALFDKMRTFVDIDNNLKEISISSSKEQKQELQFFLNAVSQLARIESPIEEVKTNENVSLEKQQQGSEKKIKEKDSLFNEALFKKLEDINFCKMLCLLSDDDEQRPKFTMDELVSLSKEFLKQQVNIPKEIATKISQAMVEAYVEHENEISKPIIVKPDSELTSKIPNPNDRVETDADKILNIFREKMVFLETRGEAFSPKLFGSTLVAKALLEKMNDSVAEPLSAEKKESLQPFLNAVIRLARAEKVLKVSLLDDLLVDNLKENEAFCKLIPLLSKQIFVFLGKGEQEQKFSVDELVRVSWELNKHRETIPKAVAQKIAQKIEEELASMEKREGKYAPPSTYDVEFEKDSNEALKIEALKIDMVKMRISQIKDEKIEIASDLREKSASTKTVTAKEVLKNLDLAADMPAVQQIPASRVEQKALKLFLNAVIHLTQIEKKLDISLSDTKLIDSLNKNPKFCKILPSLSANLLAFLAHDKLSDQLSRKFSVDELVGLSKELYNHRDSIPKEVSDKAFKKIVREYMTYKQGLNPNRYERWFGHDNKTKMAAAQELIKKFDEISKGTNVDLVYKDALKEGRLGEMVTPFITRPQGKG